MITPTTAPKRRAGWLQLHLRSLLQSAGDLVRHPLNSSMTILVIAIAMILPALFYFIGINLQAVGARWHGTPEISLYLNKNISNQHLQALMTRLSKQPTVRHVRYISPQAGWTQLTHTLNITGLDTLLPNNPLPAIIAITPKWPEVTPSQLQRMTQQLSQRPMVQQVQLDLGWVKRLFYIINIGERLIIGIASLLALGVVLIVANTIRLTLTRHHQEIKVLTLLGASRRFIIRPFLYRGFLFGLMGGLIARIGLYGLNLWLQPPVEKLASTYLNHFQLHGLDVTDSLIVVLGSALMGLIGAHIATHKQFNKATQPA